VWIRIWNWIRGSMPLPLTNISGSGSRRPKNMWIRWIRIRIRIRNTERIVEVSSERKKKGKITVFTEKNDKIKIKGLNLNIFHQSTESKQEKRGYVLARAINKILTFILVPNVFIKQPVCRIISRFTTRTSCTQYFKLFTFILNGVNAKS
jgi:hypothetical protein